MRHFRLFFSRFRTDIVAKMNKFDDVMPVAAAGVFVQLLLAVPHHVVLSTTMFLEMKKITMNL